MSATMSRTIRVELVSRDSFWRNAVSVEWAHQYPDRPLAAEEGGTILIEESWLEDLSRVASKCFSRVHVAPADPSRRLLFRRLFAPGAQR
jgi:hypothetical protein